MAYSTLMYSSIHISPLLTSSHLSLLLPLIPTSDLQPYSNHLSAFPIPGLLRTPTLLMAASSAPGPPTHWSLPPGEHHVTAARLNIIPPLELLLPSEYTNKGCEGREGAGQ
ncbi:hypothetical protein E2C01_031837 [Portunus trituberculatus]|uniref:Uncharacterized protein n=1 Tax=Portunus trituberculatus TaxID=210409 RepID=A0A5B7EVT7_PORTR|nr:hypothetical protein [Portunus trituberculatus]